MTARVAHREARWTGDAANGHAVRIEPSRRFVWIAPIVLVATFAWVVMRAPFFATSDEVRPREPIATGSAEQFVPLAGAAPDQRWDGCWLWGVSARPDRMTLTFRCPHDGAAEPDELDVVVVTSSSADRAYDVLSVEGLDGPARTRLLDRLDPVLRSMDRPRASGALSTDPVPMILVALVLLAGFLTTWCAGLWGFVAREATPPIVLVPLALALVVRFALTRATTSDVAVHFQTGVLSDVFVDKHSIVFPLVQLLVIAIGRSPLDGHLAFDAALSSLTTIPLYVFVERRTADRWAALAAALLFAVHPGLARIGASDAHFTVLLFAWCTALATLSHPSIDARSVAAGILWLALAAGCRIEGVAYAIATVPMLGLSQWRRIASHRAALVLGLALFGALTAVQYALKFHAWGPELAASWSPRSDGPRTLVALVSALTAPIAGGPLFGLLAVIALVPSRVRRHAWSIALGWLFVSFVPLSHVPHLTPLLVHRAAPSFTVEAMLGGIGVAVVIARVAEPLRMRAAAAALVAITVVALVVGRRVRTDEHSFNAEYRLARRASSAPSECALAFFFVSVGDHALYNPELILGGRPIVDCHREDCAAHDGCLIYLRTGACYPTRDGALAPMCADFEARVALTPIEEVDVDPSEAYDDHTLPTHARLGIYRVERAR
jgi:hypothetical protein